MRVIEHELTEELAIKLLGWKWMSFIGIPVRGTEGYPKKCRVRQLMSPKALKKSDWKKYFENHEGGEATMNEPLSYAYCSSSGPARLPRFIILVEEAE